MLTLVDSDFMKRVLVVDDLRVFTNAPDDTQVIYAKTAEEGIEALEAHEYWDEVFLDHDLGMAGTIKPVILYLEERAFLGQPVKIGQIYAHSSNPVGVRSIVAGLEKYYPVSVIHASEANLYAQYKLNE